MSDCLCMLVTYGVVNVKALTIRHCAGKVSQISAYPGGVTSFGGVKPLLIGLRGFAAAAIIERCAESVCM